MGLFSRRRDTETTTAIVAAATQIGSDSGEKALTSFTKRRQEWQTRAWEFYDEIGEVRQVARSMGDVFARVPWYVGVRPEPLGDVIPLDPNATPEALKELGDFAYTPDEAETAMGILDELKSPVGGQSEIRRQIGVSLFVPGECYLVGVPNETTGLTLTDDAPEIVWDVRSNEELVIDHGNKRTNSDGEQVPTYKLKAPDGTDSAAKELPADTFVVRIWRPHPRYQEWADSPMRSAMVICRELLMLTRAIEGAATSRFSGAGVMFLPNSMRNQRGPGGDGQATRTDKTVTDIIEAASLAISDPASAAAQVPLTVWLDDPVWEKMIQGKPLLQWDREIDSIAAAQRSELITRFANAIDWPAELLTGKVGINHWGAWLLKDEAFQSNAEPYEVIACDAITQYYLRPSLIAAGVDDVERFVVWYDPTGVVSDPDESDKALKASEHLLISWARERRALGFTEDDAPSDEELQKRIAIQAFIRNPALGSVPSIGGEGPPIQTPVEVPSTVHDEQPFALGTGLEHLPKVLADMDQSLFTQVHQRADAAMRRALERANSRLVALAQKDRQLRALVQGLSTTDLAVAPALGQAVIDRLTAAEDGDGEDLLAGAFVAFLLWYEVRVTRTDEEVIAMLTEQGLSDPVGARNALDAARATSGSVLTAAMLALGAELLLRPEPPGPPGESDGLLVPPGTVRGALTTAGGGGEGASMMTGDLVRSLFGQAGVGFGGYVWRYGDPSMRRHSFDPHRRLSGKTFDSPDSDVLGAQFGWPGVSHYWPGDHKGCLCLVELIAPTRQSPGVASFGEATP